jgi:hypothetical protein
VDPPRPVSDSIIVLPYLLNLIGERVERFIAVPIVKAVKSWWLSRLSIERAFISVELAKAPI